MTPQQAVNNFKLFTELSPRNTYEQYRAAVLELATLCASMGIAGDDRPGKLNQVELDTLEKLLARAIEHKQIGVSAPMKSDASTSHSTDQIDCVADTGDDFIILSLSAAGLRHLWKKTQP